MRSPVPASFATALALACLTLGLASCTGTWGGEAGEGECNPECLSMCRAECTNSVDAEGYDECSEGCDCGCD